MRKIRRPFFVVNPKSYLYGEKAVALARKADALAEKYDLDLFFTAQHVDLVRIKEAAPHLIVTAQHMDAIAPGRGMGAILPEGLKEAGVEATFLNHIEHAMTVAQLGDAIERAREVGILSIVCADSPLETAAVAAMKPDIMVCEPAKLIGTGVTSGEAYMKESGGIVKQLSPDTLVLQASGISTGEDVYNAIVAGGADGTGATSGIVAKPDPEAALEEMILAIVRARDDIEKEN
jgi:triosephosphate isomerase